MGRNKGYTHSEETKAKMRKAKIGKNNPAKRSDVRKKISVALMGRDTWMKGKKHSNKSKEKMSLLHTGIFPSEETKKKMSLARKGKHYPNLSVAKKEQYKDPTNHPNWQGGITPLNKLLRSKSMMKIWRELIFIRDNFTCQNPNCSFCNNKIGVFLHPHHIKLLSKFPELAFDVNNGITYCAEFHLKSGLHRSIPRGEHAKIH